MFCAEKISYQVLWLDVSVSLEFQYKKRNLHYIIQTKTLNIISVFNSSTRKAKKPGIQAEPWFSPLCVDCPQTILNQQLVFNSFGYFLKAKSLTNWINALLKKLDNHHFTLSDYLLYKERRVSVIERPLLARGL